MKYGIAKIDLESAGGKIKKGTVCRLGSVYKERVINGFPNNPDTEIELINGENSVTTSIKNIEFFDMKYESDEIEKDKLRLVTMYNQGKTVEEILNFFDACAVEHFGGDYPNECNGDIDDGFCKICIRNRILEIVGGDDK